MISHFHEHVIHFNSLRVQIVYHNRNNLLPKGKKENIVNWKNP